MANPEVQIFRDPVCNVNARTVKLDSFTKARRFCNSCEDNILIKFKMIAGSSVHIVLFLQKKYPKVFFMMFSTFRVNEN